jgi:uncharacterized membrane protein (DUF4010 family)
MLDFETSLARLAIALAIGLLIGLERGWSSREEKEGGRAAGIRTHALSGLLGGVSGQLSSLTDPSVLGLAFLAFALVTGLFHWAEMRVDRSVSATGAVASLLGFALGAYAVLGDPTIAAAAAVASVLLLALKQPLHGWLKRLEWIDIRAVLILTTMTFLFLPILPDQALDPWGALNPAQIWRYAIFICAISFSGYIVTHIFGARTGITIAALAGGIVSSTATTLSLARFARSDPGTSRLAAGGALLSGAVMAARVLLITSTLAPSLLSGIAAPLLTAMAVQLLIGGLYLNQSEAAQTPPMNLHNPFDLVSAFQLAALIGFILLVTAITLQYLGEQALLALAALSGIADVDAITLSLAEMADGAEKPQTLMLGILIAASTNAVTKIAISAFVGGRSLGLWFGLGTLAAVASGGLILILWPIG